jgi:hypothetical protein
MYARAAAGLGTIEAARQEICATGHCDWFRWGGDICTAAWGGQNTSAGVCSLIAPVVSPIIQPLPLPLPPPVQPSAPLPAPSAPVLAPLVDRRCPAAYPFGVIDELNQLVCKRNPQEPVAVPYNGGSTIPPVYRTGVPAGEGIPALPTRAGERRTGEGPVPVLPLAPAGSWLTQRTIIGQLPNWTVVAVAAGVVLIARKKR